MLDDPLPPLPALAGIPRPGHHGLSTGMPGLSIQEREQVEIVSIAARRGQTPAILDAVQKRWGLGLPTMPRWVGDDRLAFVWSGAGQWLAVAEPLAGDLEAELREHLSGIASMTAQGDGRVVLRVSGPHVRDVLATGIPIDLHPRVFKTGDTAITLAGHIGVQIRQIDDQSTFDLMAFRGFAGDLCDWLTEAGRAFGVEVLNGA